MTPFLPALLAHPEAPPSVTPEAAVPYSAAAADALQHAGDDSGVSHPSQPNGGQHTGLCGHCQDMGSQPAGAVVFPLPSQGLA